MNTTMLSLARPFNTIPAQVLFTSHHHHVPSLVLGPIKSSNNSINSEASNDGGNASTPIPPPITPPPDKVEIRFRRGSRRRRKQQQDSIIDGQPMKERRPAAPKDWDSMTLTEKAVELYMGEKGVLFWLNKFAYASIFIIIGGWIVFRFVGPALNLYQLDSAPLSPTSIFKGSPENP